jgi:hypothetical protein
MTTLMHPAVAAADTREQLDVMEARLTEALREIERVASVTAEMLLRIDTLRSQLTVVKPAGAYRH